MVRILALRCSWYRCVSGACLYYSSLQLSSAPRSSRGHGSANPNIAKVLDAGTTDTGRPYFVMDLVRGIPITQYCDEARLSPRERLELFLPLCQAI
ncbi:MAG: hypothetical protein ACLQVF_33395 [Isosphaeraceae bacterium]